MSSRSFIFYIKAKKLPLAEAERLLDDPSPLVRGAAVWALGRLLDGAAFATLRGQRLVGEADADVLAEWLVEVGTRPSHR